MEKQHYRIWCEVHGGRTGNHASWLNDAKGIARFPTRHGARRRAKELRAQMNDEHATAQFLYTIRKILPQDGLVIKQIDPRKKLNAEEKAHWKRVAQSSPGL